MHHKLLPSSLAVALLVSAGAACAQYRYAPNVKDAGGNFIAPTTQVYAQQSLYSIRVGVRFSF